MADDEIVVRLSHAEGLVLFEWLARMDDSGRLPIEHPAEQTVLWRLEGQLEKQIPELFSPTYGQVLDDARRSIDSSPR